MKALIDTSVLVRDANKSDSLHSVARGVIEQLLSQAAQIFVAPQVLYELWVVATRPIAANGLGFSVAQTRQIIENALRLLTVREDPPDLFERWLSICTEYEVTGKAAHDARLVAWMQSHGIDHIVTLNAAHFRRYPEMHLIVPARTE